MSRRQKQRTDPTVGIVTVEQCREAIADCLADVEREDRDWHLGWRCINRLKPLEDGDFFDLDNVDGWDKEVRPIGRTMQMLCAFAEETLEFKARPRDPFAGERRRLAREILRAMGQPGEPGA